MMVKNAMNFPASYRVHMGIAYFSHLIPDGVDFCCFCSLRAACSYSELWSVLKFSKELGFKRIVHTYVKMYSHGNIKCTY